MARHIQDRWYRPRLVPPARLSKLDDHLNPCRSSSVRAPKLDPRRIVPWPRERVLAVRSVLPEQYRAMVDLAGGCGLRQGEVFGLAVEDVDFVEGVIRVVRQIKLIRNRPVFASLKGAKGRTVPLPESVARSVEEHISQHPPAAVTLPWRAVDGAPVTACLICHRDHGRPINRNDFNRGARRPALDAADVPLGRASGMHALRHFYASVLLDTGESIKALSEYLGHHDPGFTLRTYTHLMPSSEKRTREAVNRAFADGPDPDRTALRRPRGTDHTGKWQVTLRRLTCRSTDHRSASPASLTKPTALTSSDAVGFCRCRSAPTRKLGRRSCCPAFGHVSWGRRAAIPHQLVRTRECLFA